MKYKTGDYVVTCYEPDLIIPDSIFARVEELRADSHDRSYVRVKDAKGRTWYVYNYHLRPATDAEILHHKLLGF